MLPEDRILARGLAKGKESAYRKLFSEHFQPLYEMALHLVQDDYAAKTIVGDFFFHIWEIRGNLNIGSSLRGYLTRGVYNRCLNWLKSNDPGRKEPLSEDIGNAPVTPLEEILAKELEREIAGVVGSLPSQTRKVFIMHRMEGQTYEQISSRTGLSVNTVKYHLKRALAKLRKSIGNPPEALPEDDSSDV